MNDGPLRGLDTSRPQTDITADVRRGANTIKVRVSSSLNNRLLARGYFDTVQDIAALLARGEVADAEDRRARPRAARPGTPDPGTKRGLIVRAHGRGA